MKRNVLIYLTAFVILLGALFLVVQRKEDTTTISSANVPQKNKSPQQTAETDAPVIQLTDIQQLVNKEHGLPADYVPPDLTKPNVKFVYQTEEIKQMRKEAADALEEMFAAAEKDGVPLAAVSGYRSYQTQKVLYNNYVKRDGQEAADRYSARPGHSEHMTGLSMDIAGADGKCAASDCFHDTKEAQWLKENAHKYGFILRYPPGKEEITGYKHESWHYRYVGKPLATFIYEKEITLEEYYQEYVKK